MLRLCKDGLKGNQVNNMVIPFAYDYHRESQSFEQFISKLCDKEASKWVPVNVKESNNELYEHILSLTADDLTDQTSRERQTNGSNYIAQALELNTKSASYPNFSMTCKGLSANISFQFDQILLFLFDSGIGFLILSMDYSQFTTMDQVIIANNQVKAIKHSDLYKVETLTDFIPIEQIEIADVLPEEGDQFYPIIDDTDKKTTKYIRLDQIPIHKDAIIEIKIIYYKKIKSLKIKYNKISETLLPYKKLLSNIISDIEIKTYFNQSYSRSVGSNFCNKANIFSALTIHYEQEDEKEIGQNFFRLRKGYSNSYIPDVLEYSDNNPEVFKPFHDSYWGVSREGCANLTYDTNDFMKFGYTHRITTYFYLYIIALHQYYGLLYLAKEVSYLPSTIQECIDEKVYQKLIDIRNNCTFFYMKCIFDEVSHITHQAHFYDRLIHILGIKNMQRELNFEMERIASIVEQVKDMELAKEKAEKEEEEKRREKLRQQEKEIEEKKKEEKQKFLSRIGFFFVSFSIISLAEATISFWVNVSDVEKRFAGYEIIYSILTLAFVFALCIALILCYSLIKWIKKKKK